MPHPSFIKTKRKKKKERNIDGDFVTQKDMQAEVLYMRLTLLINLF